MRKLLLIPFLALMMSASAQTKEETAVASAVEYLKKAMLDGDRDALMKISSDQLSYGHSSGLVENKQQFIEKIASGTADFLSMDLANQTIIVSGNTALVRHELHAKLDEGGKPLEIHLRVLLVMQKQSGNWVMLGRQAVKIQ